MVQHARLIFYSLLLLVIPCESTLAQKIPVTPIDSLKDGVSLVVFPEGARTFTGHMGYFKKGAFQLADDLQLAVVPVTIDGSFEILPRTGKWIHRHRMILTIHEPIPPKGKGMENIKATMAEAYAAVESALPEQYKGMVKNEDQDR